MRIFLVVLFLILAVSTTYIYVKNESPADQNPHKSTGQAAIGGAFSLTDQNGKPVTEQDFRGKYMLVFFGFTSCPDVCPVAGHTMGEAMKKISDAQRAKLAMLFITVDPQRDTPEVLKKYLANFDERIVGLTGSDEKVKAAESAYKVYSAVHKKPGEKDYGIDHSSYMYLMDTDGTYIAHFPHDVPLDKLVESLNTNIQ